MTELKVENVSLSKDGTAVLKRVSFSVRSGELAVMLGPNGAGKSLSLKAALGLETGRTGSALLGGQDTQSLTAITRARLVSYLPQTRKLAWPSRVDDLVGLGRYAHGARLGKLGEADARAVNAALKACDIAHLAKRSADTLSGGELARVHCARAFAAEAPLLIADEPIAALDPSHQFRIMDLFKAFVSKGGGALIVLHDIALAAKYADRLIWMKDGEIVADGATETTLSTQRLSEVYGVRADVSGRDVRMLGPV